MPEKLLAGSLVEEQISRELQSISEGVLRYRKMVRDAQDRGEGSHLKPAERILTHWYEPYVRLIRMDQRRIRSGRAMVGAKWWGKPICRVNAKKIAVVSMHAALGRLMSDQGGVPVFELGGIIGGRINAIAEMPSVRRDKQAFHRLSKTSRRKTYTHQAILREARKLERSDVWPLRSRVELGIRLMWHLVSVASTASYDDDFQLAFHHEKVMIKGKPTGVLRLDARVIEIMDEGHRAREYLRPTFAPMIVPPLPWMRGGRGGFLRIRRSLVQPPYPQQQDMLEKADLSSVMSAVNRLNHTEYSINDFILRTQQCLWRDGGNIVGIPHRDPICMPIKPDDIDTNKLSRKAYSSAAAEVYRANAIIRSTREQYSGALVQAESLIGRPFWIPHQLCFRGRAYPVSQHLHYQSSDPVRSLFLFNDGGNASSPEARDWLKIHFANCCGIDKVSYDARIAWANDMRKEWMTWATAPLENDGWMDQDKPWQALAAARELYDVIELGKKTHLPVHVDGSCNGLQHYAAIGRDMEGAEVVNMLPRDAPSDIYTIVAGHVSRRVERDDEEGVRWAADVVNLINRKTVKQTVMTTTYGVTIVGARLQIYERLKEQGLDPDSLYPASIYLSRVVMDEVSGVFTGARTVMDAIKDWARGQDGALTWTSPIGLPIVQPYFKMGSKQVSTSFGRIKIATGMTSEVRRSKQISSSAPNFVHSLDASHMMMTVNSLPKDTPFMGVHDSYATTADKIPMLQCKLREAFIEMHNQPCLEALRGINTPPRGRFDISQIMNAQYFFS